MRKLIGIFWSEASRQFALKHQLPALTGMQTTVSSEISATNALMWIPQQGASQTGPSL